MLGIRTLILGAVKARPILFLKRLQTPMQVQKCNSHDHEGPPQPFDNLPFNFKTRYVATVVFAFLFGVGLWAPFLIVWYSMAKRTF